MCVDSYIIIHLEGCPDVKMLSAFVTGVAKGVLYMHPIFQL